MQNERRHGAAIPGDLSSPLPDATKDAIVSVQPDSIASELDLQPGDRLIAVDGRSLRDVLDYRFYTAADALTLTLCRGEQRWDISVKTNGADLGLGFAEPSFDGIRRCANNCDFCFLAGLPRGLRSSVYVKDDDYRYSFLYGTFVTLTNLVEEDWHRLAEQRLSPLYVSVHATELELRRKLLHNPRAPHVLDQLAALGRLRIQVHTQVVLCPGLNDGAHLDTTIRDLAELFPTVQSIGIVPVGLTAHHRKAQEHDIRGYSRAEALALLQQIEHWQQQLRASLGVSLVYAADELYLMADAPIPEAGLYDDFPQYENGIGMVRTLLDDWTKLKRARRSGSAARRDATLVCGTSIAPLLRQIAADLSCRWSCTLDVQPVVNRFFGPSVTVSGLLTGGDIQRQLATQRHQDIVAIPRVALDAAGARFLDDIELSELGQRLDAQIVAVDSLSQLGAALRT
ncbi:MAG: DUF512 domain-containing protein [Chloroflexota bacterium]|nr:MAG: DUF512 domain-containing protein [Chloroflexota bacterium]